MKKRQGFVSNSSTSSFCIQGAYLGDFLKVLRMIQEHEPAMYEKAVRKNFKPYKDQDPEDRKNQETDLQKYLNIENEEMEDGAWEGYEILQDCDCGELSLSTGEESVYAGISWENIKDEETAKEFKKRAQDEMDRIFGKGIKTEFICETIST